MFAFLLLDPRTSRLHAVRDRFGVKPLYWARIGASIVFASEIKQIRAFPGFVPRLNTSAVRDYLADGLLDHTRCTFDEGIEQLLGGERAIVRLDCDNPGVEIVRWYELKAETWRGTDEGAAVRFEELLSDSVRVRLRSDVPVGSCLSGGLDSSSIVCLAHRALKEQGGQARQVTVTACFEDERFDEWRYAEKVIAQTEAIAVRVWPSFEQLEQEWDRFLWQMDEPCGSTSQFSQWRVFDGAAGAGLKVMLDGQGSDEQLAGYSGGTPIALLTGLLSRRTVGSFVGEVMAMRRARGRLPLAEMALAARNIFPPLTSLLPARLRNGNSKPDWLRLDAPPLTSRKAGALCDALRQQTLSTSLPALLRYEDRNSMAWSVESRVPFLDYRLVEFLAGLPDHLKLHRTITKVVLREGMRGIIPEDIRQRRDKMGFVTPEEVWLRETAPTWFRRNIEASLRAAPHIFDAERVRRMLEDMISGRAGFTFAPWRIACLGRWLSISAGRAGDSDASVRN
jgi:asparagine synthase (glutamine-hydrolysing)